MCEMEEYEREAETKRQRKQEGKQDYVDVVALVPVQIGFRWVDNLSTVGNAWLQ